MTDPTTIPGARPEEDEPDDSEGFIAETVDGQVTVAHPADPAKETFTGLRWRERRRRLRRAKRDGRRLYRGRFIPRTLKTIVFVGLVAGLVAGAATAGVYAIMDARVARAEKAGRVATTPTTAPVKIDVGPGAEGDAPVSDIVIETVATGIDPTIEGIGVAVLNEDGVTYWLTAYDLVGPATISPPAPIKLRGTDILAGAWSWDTRRDLGLVTTTDPAGTPRPWAGADLSLISGSLLAVILPSPDGPSLPVTVAVAEPLTGPLDTFTVAATGTTLPLGAAVTAPDGRLVGVITDIDGAGTETVATVSAVRNACERVLSCEGVG